MTASILNDDNPKSVKQEIFMLNLLIWQRKYDGTKNAIWKFYNTDLIQQYRDAGFIVEVMASDNTCKITW